MIDIPSWGRTLLVVAHYDDETLGFGGHLSDFRPAVCHLTDSSEPGSVMGVAAAGIRTREWNQVMDAAGISAGSSASLGFPDQKLSGNIEEAVHRVRELAARLDVQTILTHAYEGGHPDHDSAALICALARKSPSLRLFEFSLYHRRVPGPEDPAEWEFGRFLGPGGDAVEIELCERRWNQKQALLGCYSSQREFLERFMDSLRIERFRVAPAYDFTAPPHEGKLLYETFDWGISAQDWLEATKPASRSLR